MRTIPLYVNTPEAWAKFRAIAKGKAKDASLPDLDPVVLTKEAPRVHVGGRITTEKALLAFIKGAAKDVKEAAVAAFETTKAASDDGAVMIPAVLSDDTVDRDDDTLAPSGWRLGDYNNNPVMLFGHDHGLPAIGNGYGVHVSGSQLKGIATFTRQDENPMGCMLGKLYAARVMRMFSVGFIPKVYSFNDDRGMFAIDNLEQELIEFSGVNVGSNRNAMAEARGLGIDVSPIVDFAAMALDGAAGLWVPRAELEAIVADHGARKIFSIPDAATMAKRGGFKAALSAIEKAITDEKADAIKAARDAARIVPDGTEKVGDELVDWKAVAVALAKDVGVPGAFVRAKQAHSFSLSEEKQMREERAATDAAAAALVTSADEVEHVEPEDPTKVDPSTTTTEEEPKKPEPAVDPAPVETPPTIDPSANAGHDDQEAMSIDDLRKLATEVLDRGISKLKAEVRGDLD